MGNVQAGELCRLAETGFRISFWLCVTPEIGILVSSTCCVSLPILSRIKGSGLGFVRFPKWNPALRFRVCEVHKGRV